MPKGKCKFDQRLLKNDKYKQWLQPANGDLYKAYCILCKTSFSTEYGCESSIKSHSRGTLHRKLEDEKLRQVHLWHHCSSHLSGKRRMNPQQHRQRHLQVNLQVQSLKY